MLNQKGYTRTELVAVLLIFLAIIAALGGGIGWGMNIYKFTQCDFKAPYKAEILRGVGIPVIPLGIVCGYVTIED